jgi:hypothetical protein
MSSVGKIDEESVVIEPIEDLFSLYYSIFRG